MEELSETDTAFIDEAAERNDRADLSRLTRRNNRMSEERVLQTPSIVSNRSVMSGDSADEDPRKKK